MEPNPAMTFEFVYNYDDIRAALALLNGGKKPLFARSFIGWIFFLSIAVFIYLVFHSSHHVRPPGLPIALAKKPNSGFIYWLITTGPYFFVGIFILFLIIRNALGKRKAWEKADKKEVNHVMITPTGIVWETTSFRTENKWTHYQRVAEGPSVFVLFVADRMGATLPKRVMAPEQIIHLRNLFAANIGKAKGFEVLPPGH